MDNTAGATNAMLSGAAFSNPAVIIEDDRGVSPRYGCRIPRCSNRSSDGHWSNRPMHAMPHTKPVLMRP